MEKGTEDVALTSRRSLTISCVNVDTSDVESSGRLIARRPSLGWRITLNVMTRFEVLLKSFVTASKSSLVMVAEDPKRSKTELNKLRTNWPLFFFLAVPSPVKF